MLAPIWLQVFPFGKAKVETYSGVDVSSVVDERS